MNAVVLNGDFFENGKNDKSKIDQGWLLNTILENSWHIIGRYGGEEFLAILPHTKLNSAEIVAERIRKEIQLLKLDEEYLIISCSHQSFPEQSSEPRRK